MSSILEEAVIHANTLREAAIKNAEQIVIEKYSADIKDAVEKLLEGTEEVIDSIPFAHEELLTKEDVSKPVELPLKDVTGKEELQEEIDIDIEQVKSVLSEMHIEDEYPEGEDEEDYEIDLMDLLGNKSYGLEDEPVDENQAGGEYEEGDLDIDLSGDSQDDIPTARMGSSEEEFDLSKHDSNDYSREYFDSDSEEVDLDALLGDKSSGVDDDDDYSSFNASDEYLEESIHFNTKVVPTGWLGANQSTLGEAELVDVVARIAEESMKEEREANKKELAKKQKEAEKLKAELAESNKKLNQLTQVVQSLKDKLVESNTTNGKLFYTNCVLKDPSLNERQKEKLVENLSNAESLEQAKVIYETLNSVGSTNSGTKKPKSLSEALNRSSSLVISARRTEEKKEVDPLYNSWKKLAGL